MSRPLLLISHCLGLYHTWFPSSTLWCASAHCYVMIHHILIQYLLLDPLTRQLTSLDFSQAAYVILILLATMECITSCKLLPVPLQNQKVSIHFLAKYPLSLLVFQRRVKQICVVAWHKIICGICKLAHMNKWNSRFCVIIHAFIPTQDLRQLQRSLVFHQTVLPLLQFCGRKLTVCTAMV